MSDFLIGNILETHLNAKTRLWLSASLHKIECGDQLAFLIVPNLLFLWVALLLLPNLQIWKPRNQGVYSSSTTLEHTTAKLRGSKGLFDETVGITSSYSDIWT